MSVMSGRRSRTSQAAKKQEAEKKAKEAAAKAPKKKG